ncbi:MAG: hypothetical protein QOH32_3984 [Bradyrhizobium sp.]|jgi:hypothetical protein|nr:hypothetical protein [Bradyrhizobium sp.]
MFKEILDIADRLGIIQALKTKLLRQPDPAADKLVAVLGELSKIYLACDAELLRYLSLSFDPAGDIAEERTTLLTLEGGQLLLRTSEARGHCHKIRNIYQRYLQRWFHDVLAPDEAATMKELFERLSYGDSQMELAIHELSNWLTREAQNTLDLVDAGKFDEANQHIKAARKEVQATREGIRKAMSELVQLQGDFITASGTV